MPESDLRKFEIIEDTSEKKEKEKFEKIAQIKAALVFFARKIGQLHGKYPYLHYEGRSDVEARRVGYPKEAITWLKTSEAEAVISELHAIFLANDSLGNSLLNLGDEAGKNEYFAKIMPEISRSEMERIKESKTENK